MGKKRSQSGHECLSGRKARTKREFGCWWPSSSKGEEPRELFLKDLGGKGTHFQYQRPDMAFLMGKKEHVTGGGRMKREIGC